MDKLLAVSAGVGQPLRPEDWAFIQEVNRVSFLQFINSLIAPTNFCILTGLKVTIANGTISVTPGTYFDGNEISFVSGSAFTYNGVYPDDIWESGPWYLYIKPMTWLGETRTFKDNSVHHVYQYNRYVVCYDKIGPFGIANAMMLYYAESIIPIIKRNLDIPTVYEERIVTIPSYDLDQSHVLVLNQGIGTIIQVISIVCKNVITSPLSAGGQNINITYGVDATTAEVGLFPNSFIENTITCISNMVPNPGRMYENQAITVGFSMETRPSAGLSTFIFKVTYKVINY